MNIRNILRSVKPFLSRFEVQIDRNRQLIAFKNNGKTEILTVNQLFDEIESILTKPKPAAQVTLDPFGAGTIDRLTPPNVNISPPDGSWLSNYHQPITNPLSQPTIEPARPLRA